MEHLLSPVKSACCFTGHRPDALPARGDARAAGMVLLRQRLICAVEDAVTDGVTDFYAGGAQGFDLLAGDIVLLVAASAKNVRLHLALPSKTFGAGYPASCRQRLEKQRIFADTVWYAMEKGAPFYAFHARDRYMVEHAGRVIAYLKKPTGGTRYTVDYARSRNLPVRNLAEEIAELGL